jgi:NAD(P)-dependent dehydrogenase (short-subunit alcohol dehydrogenase family)
MDVRDLAGKHALVTGAASGIGKATALELARHGADMVLCDIDQAGLEATEKEIGDLGREVFARRIDVSHADEMERFAQEVHTRIGAVDLLVNNAGVGLVAGFLEMDLENWDWIVGITLKGVIHGCHFFVPRMVERGQGGHVVNVASLAGFIPGPPLCAYNVTKAGVVSLSESLRSELRPHGIGVTAVCPGIIDTPIASNMRYRGTMPAEEARQLGRDAMRRRNYSPERVARNVLKAVSRNRAVAPISLEAWIGYYMKRFFPRFTLWLIATLTERQRRQMEAEKKSS